MVLIYGWRNRSFPEQPVHTRCVQVLRRFIDCEIPDADFQATFDEVYVLFHHPATVTLAKFRSDLLPAHRGTLTLVLICLTGSLRRIAQLNSGV